MNSRKAGMWISFTGMTIVFFSVTIDYMGIGKPGIQAVQILGILAGIVISFLGWGIILKWKEENGWDIHPINLFRTCNVPVVVWIIIGFLFSFFPLYVIPKILNAQHKIQYFNRFIPEITPIGRDLMFSTNNIQNWLTSGSNLYQAAYHVYPPLYAIVFAPFVLLDYPARFYFVTAITFASVVISTLLLPALTKATKSHSIYVFFFLTAVISYGLLFEFERGQYNVIAFTLALVAIYLFHYQPSFRHLAYLFFSISVHLKIYPVIFVLMFIKDWRDWRNNIMRLIWLGLFNVSLLFVLGSSMFIEFIKAIMNYTNDTWSRPYNMSIRSFVYALANQEVVPLTPSTAIWLSQNMRLIEVGLLAFFVICLVVVIAKAYLRANYSINYDLLAISTVGALLVPSVSIDYKLPLLAAPLALALSHRSVGGTEIKRAMIAVLIIIVSAAYTVTLFPFIDKPVFLANNLPMLVLILSGITLLNLLDESAMPQHEK